MSYYNIKRGEGRYFCEQFVSIVRQHFFVSRNSAEKLCVSQALPFVECVAVWALKLPVLHTDALKPTSHKVFLRNYWKPKEPATNNRHKIIISNSVLYQIIRCIKKQLLITIHMCVKLSLVLPYSVGGSPSSQEYQPAFTQKSFMEIS